MSSKNEYKGATAMVFVNMFFVGTSNILFSATKEGLMEAYGVGLAHIGFLMMLRGIVNGALPIVSGGLSDKLGRKKLITLGIAILAAYYMFTPMFHSYYLLIALVPLLSAGIAFADPTSQSVLFDVYENPTKIMPFIQVAFSGGCLTAPILISIMLERGIDWRLAYYFYGLLSLILIGFVLTRRFPPLTAKKTSRTKSVSEFKKAPSIKREGLTICLLVICFSIIGCVVSNWADVYVSDVFNFEPARAIRVLSYYQIGCMFGAFLTLWLARKIHSTRIMIIHLTTALLYYCLALLQSNGTMFVLFIVMTGMSVGTLYSLSVGLLGFLFRENSGAAAGAIGSSSSIGIAIGSSLAGRYIDIIGVRNVFIAMAAVILSALILSIVIRKQYKGLWA